MAQTETWLTQRRLERGVEKANAELRRWSREKRLRELGHEMRSVFRPVRVYGDAGAMRRDALASRQKLVGSALMARDVDAIGAFEVLIGIAAVGGGIALGLWIGKRWKTSHVAASEYLHGIDDVLGEAA